MIHCFRTSFDSGQAAFHHEGLYAFNVLIVLIACLFMGPIAADAQIKSEPPNAPLFDVGFIGLHGGVYEQLLTHAKLLEMRLTYFEDGDITAKTADFSTVRVLYVQHTREEDRDAYRALIEIAQAKSPSLRIYVLPANAAEFFQGLNLKSKVERDADAAAYYGSSSENLRRLLLFNGAKHLGRDWKIEPPQEVDREGLYHPDHDGLFPSAGAFQVWSRSRGVFAAEKPRLLITVHSTHLAFQQPRVVDALIREAERQGAVAVAIVDGRSKLYEEQAAALSPHSVIHTCHSSDVVNFRKALNIPHLQSIFIRKQSIDEWQQSLDGLSSSELAFHIIGQELIGGIEPQVAAGTNSGQGSAEAFQPIPDRVEHLPVHNPFTNHSLFLLGRK